MKKFLVILLVAMFTLSLVACNGKSGSADISNENQSSIESALALLTEVWSSYNDDEKFPIVGGDLSEENMTENAPGKFSVDDPVALDTTLGFPSAAVDKIDEAASLVHMMNANTFTCGVFHVKNESDSSDVADAIKNNIMQRQWMCGFPDKLVIVKVDDYIISFFGANDLIDTFKSKLTETYPSAEVICDDPIA